MYLRIVHNWLYFSCERSSTWALVWSVVCIYLPLEHVLCFPLFGFWCLMPLSTKYFSYIVAVSFIGGGSKPEYREKTTDLSQVTDKVYHIMLYRVHLTRAGFKLTTLVVIGADCIGSYKSNHHTIMTIWQPLLWRTFVHIAQKIFLCEL